jgi:hypothetical protein
MGRGWAFAFGLVGAGSLGSFAGSGRHGLGVHGCQGDAVILGVPLGVILIDRRKRRILGYGQGVGVCFGG